MKAPAARGRSGRSSGRESGSDWPPLPLLLLTTPLAHVYFHHAGHDPDVVVEEIAYYDVLIFGSGAVILAGTLSSFFTGRGATRVVMAVDSTAAALNAVLAYALDLRSRGISSRRHCRRRRGHGLRGMVPRDLLCGHHDCGPAIASIAWHRDGAGTRASCGGSGLTAARAACSGSSNARSFTLFITLVGGLGKINQAATMLAFNVNSVAWVPMMGMGLAVSTMVGQQLGANRPDMAARAAWTAFVLAMIYMCTMSMFYVAVPDWFLMGHAAGMAPEQFEPLRDVDRRPAAVRGRVLPARCDERGFHERHPRGRRHAFRVLDVAGHVASAAEPGLAGHSPSRPGPALVLDAHHALGLLRRPDLPRTFPARQVADDAGH